MPIEVSNITKKYNKQTALDNINLKINTGEIVGLIGPNGVGKTTLMKIICGLLTPDSGNVLIDNMPIIADTLEIKKKLGYLPENNPLYLDMYITEYLEFTGKLYKINKIDLKKRIKEIIDITGIYPERKKKIKQLSKGFRQRVGIALTLIHDPQILILDEPTTGLDPNQIIEIRNLIKNVSENKTIILSTHILQEVEAICSRVIIINKGKILADDTTAKLQESANKQSIILEIDKEAEENIFYFSENVFSVKSINNRTFIIEAIENVDIREELFNFAIKNNWKILSMQIKNKKLEEIFREMTNE